MTTPEIPQIRQSAPHASEAFGSVALIGASEAEDQKTKERNILIELEPLVAENLNRHLARPESEKNWNPHDFVPWSEGRDFAYLGGEDWEPNQSRLSPLAKRAMILGLLTEDNLPSYHREIATTFGRDGAWGTWVGRWTAEEGRHGIALRDYLVVTRGVDPVALEQARIDHMTRGFDNGDKPLLNTLAYVTFQELATFISHRNTGKISGDPIADDLLGRIAKDETMHMVFYRNLMSAALERYPNEALEAITAEVAGFEMPGENLPDFSRTKLMIANGGIYSPAHHLHQVIEPVLRIWKPNALSGLNRKGEEAQKRLNSFLGTLGIAAANHTERMERRAARAMKSGDPSS